MGDVLPAAAGAARAAARAETDRSVSTIALESAHEHDFALAYFSIRESF